jgi:hypothetical protein
VELNKQGTLMKQGKRFGAWKPAYFILADHVLSYQDEKGKVNEVCLLLLLL